MDILNELGMIAFSARIRRLSDTLTQGVLDMYKRQNPGFDLRYAPILLILQQREAIISSEISEALGYTKSAVSQTLADMLQEGLIIEQANSSDRRKKQLKLSDRGEQLIQELTPVWVKAEAIFRQVQTESGINLLQTLAALEGALNHKSIIQRYQEIDA